MACLPYASPHLAHKLTRNMKTLRQSFRSVLEYAARVLAPKIGVFCVCQRCRSTKGVTITHNPVPPAQEVQVRSPVRAWTTRRNARGSTHTTTCPRTKSGAIENAPGFRRICYKLNTPSSLGLTRPSRGRICESTTTTHVVFHAYEPYLVTPVQGCWCFAASATRSSTVVRTAVSLLRMHT